MYSSSHLLIHRIHLLILHIYKSFILLLGKIHLPFTHKHLKASDYRDALSILRPGMVLISRTHGELTNLCISSYYTHASIYIDHNQVVEAIGKGVVQTDLIDWMMTKDHVVILQPLFCGTLQMSQASEWAWKQVGKPYDTLFDVTNNDEFYCSELVWEAYDHAAPNNPFELRYRLGRLTVLGDDFYNAKDKWQIVWNSNV